jgi:hypothetical protein
VVKPIHKLPGSAPTSSRKGNGLPFAIQLRLTVKFGKREKQIGVRIRSDEHAALKEIAEREGQNQNRG